MSNKFLKITGILVLLLAMGGFWGYNKYFKSDPEIQQQLNTQFGEDFFSFDDEKDVGHNSGKGDNVESKSDSTPGAELNNKTDSPTAVANEQGESKTTPTSTSENGNTATKPITQAEVSAKYSPQFQHLQNVALDRLDTLYSAAIQEYVQQKKAGTLNRSALAQKYIQAGNRLEASLDSQFNSTLNEMKAELVANNLSTDVVSAIKSQYESVKSSKRSQLLSGVRL